MQWQNLKGKPRDPIRGMEDPPGIPNFPLHDLNQTDQKQNVNYLKFFVG